jgi:ureidoglycolate hydrolase
MKGGNMDEQLLEIRQYLGTGYQPLIDYSDWRVAILRWEEASLPGNIESMERHTQTDEVFVLLDGWATLLIGGNQGKVDDIQAEVMSSGKLFNVKQNTWHTILLSRDASILIVENRDTGQDNSEFFQLTPEQRLMILGLEYHQ